MGTRTGSGGKGAVERNRQATALAKLADAQGVALAQAQQAQRHVEHDGLDGLARFGALLRTADAVLRQAMTEAARPGADGNGT